MAHARDAETIGLLFQGMVREHCRTVSLLAQQLGVPYGPPLLVALGVTDDPRSRWGEVEGLVGLLQLAERPAAPPRDLGVTWEAMTEQERSAWMHNAQSGPD